MADQRLDQLTRFYDLLARLEKQLGGPRKLSCCTGRMDWPRRGVYFFVEPGEVRSDTGSGQRVVRVGTHALKAGARSKLWKRLSRHRGAARSGVGNHQGSIFRGLIGRALMERDGFVCPEWKRPQKQIRGELPECDLESLEKLVSEVLGRMGVLWLAIEDESGPRSLRGYIERNAIALLSNSHKKPIDPPSRNWLGSFCDSEAVKKSGLWNQNHTDEEFDPAFLTTIEERIENK